MERIVKLSGGDQSKFGPGARAKAAARRNAQSSGSFLIPGANGFVPQRTYYRYHETAPLSYKPRVKVSDSPFQGDGTLTRSQKRNLPHKSDVYISEENVVVRHRQANFKTWSRFQFALL